MVMIDMRVNKLDYLRVIKVINLGIDDLLVNSTMKQIKNNIAAALYSIIFYLVKIIPAKNGTNSLLVIKTDEIGDYILFRNLFKYFKQSEKYKNYKITLVGNLAWKKMYDEYDTGCFDETIWLDKTKFKRDLSYRFSFLNGIRQQHTSDVINCVFSRGIYIDDGIAFVATGVNKFAMSSDKTNRGRDARDWDKGIYTKIESPGDEKIFDSVRNRNFMETVLLLPGLSADTKISIPHKSEIPDLPYFILFIGAGNPERRWPIDSFVEAAKYASSRYGATAVVCGGPGDETDAQEFMNKYGQGALNYAGKTTLTYMMELLSRAKFLICVDTGALHMGVSAGCPVIGLYSGKFYGRFAPYPAEITKQFYVAYPDFVDALIAKHDPVLYDTTIMKNDTMKLIPAKKILPYIDQIMG